MAMPVAQSVLAGTGIGLPVVVVACWLIEVIFKVTVPAEVAGAMGVALSQGITWYVPDRATGARTREADRRPDIENHAHPAQEPPQ